MRQTPSSNPLPSTPDVPAGPVRRLLERFAGIALLDWGWLLPDPWVPLPTSEDRLPRRSSIGSCEIDAWH
jgi:hypothetical protein